MFHNFAFQDSRFQYTNLVLNHTARETQAKAGLPDVPYRKLVPEENT